MQRESKHNVLTVIKLKEFEGAIIKRDQKLKQSKEKRHQKHTRQGRTKVEKIE
jgi:hypothetical protein